MALVIFWPASSGQPSKGGESMEKDEGVRIEECVGMTLKRCLCRLPSLPDKLRVSRRLENWNAIGTLESLHVES
jgi:hypothetical protein